MRCTSRGLHCARPCRPHWQGATYESRNAVQTTGATSLPPSTTLSLFSIDAAGGRSGSVCMDRMFSSLSAALRWSVRFTNDTYLMWAVQELSFACSLEKANEHFETCGTEVQSASALAGLVVREHIKGHPLRGLVLHLWSRSIH